MLRWASKTMWSQRGSLFGSSAGVAAVFILVVFFDAVFTGESENIVTYIRHADADVWAMQSGVRNMHMASSFVSDWKVDAIAGVDGVAQVTPILYLNSVVKMGDRDWFSYIVGLESGSRQGGPWSLKAGREVASQGEAVVPEVLARMTGLGIGDRIYVTDRALEIVGLSSGTFSMANSIFFIHMADLADVLETTTTFSYLLVKARPGVDAVTLAQRIEQQVDKITAMPSEEFIASDYQIAIKMGVEIIAIMTLICAALAMLIIAFVAYSQVSHKRRELAIAKALGVENRFIYFSVILYAFAVTILAVILTIAFAYIVMPGISLMIPQITLVVTTDVIINIAMMSLIVAMAAAAVPAFMVVRVDPMTVFNT